MHVMSMEFRTIRTSRSLLLPGMTLTIVTAFAGGCRSPQGDSFEGISRGMSRDEVIEVLGPPSSRLNAPADSPGSPWAVRWHWGDTLGTLATHAAMADQPPPGRVWTVWFDASGHVIEATSPHDSPASSDTPWLPPPTPAR